MSIVIFHFLEISCFLCERVLFPRLAVLRLVVEHLAELSLVELAVDAAACEQLVVCALLGDDAVLDDEYAVGLEDGREPVRDHNVGAALHDGLQRILDRIFRDRVEGRRGLVQDQDARVLEHHARDGQALLFPTGEL